MHSIKNNRFKSFGSIASVQAALNNVMDEQLASASEKARRPGYWHDVPALERRAVERVRQGLSEMDDTQNVEQFVLEAHRRLELIATELRNDSDDADGYGLGTVYAIQRVLLNTQLRSTDR